MITLLGGCRIQRAFHGGIECDIGIVGNASQSGSGGMVGMLAARPRDVRGYFACFLIEAHDINLGKAAALVGIGGELIIRRHERAVAHSGRVVCARIGRPRRAIEAINVFHVALHAFKPFGLVRHRNRARLGIFIEIDALDIFQIRRAQRALGVIYDTRNGLRRSVRRLEVRHIGIAVFRIGGHNIHRGAEDAVLKRRLGIEYIRTVVSHVGIGNIERSERIIVVVNVRALHQNAIGYQRFFVRLKIALHLRLLNFHLCGSATGKGRKRAGCKSNRHRSTQP